MAIDKYPSFVGRQKEIDTLTSAVKKSGQRNYIVLLNGTGGIGKTWLMQRLEQRLKYDADIFSTHLMDMDDTSYHLPSYFLRVIAEAIQPEAFKAYFSALQYYQDEARRQIDWKTIYAHLRKSEYAFFDDYNRLTRSKRAAILIDTFEEVQDTDFWNFLTRFVDEIENTTFVIAGRRVEGLTQRLKDSEAEIASFDLAGLSGEEINEFFKGITEVNDERRRKLGILTNGNPLLLCLAVDCYRHGYWPEDIDKKSISEIEAQISLSTEEAQRLRYEFEKSLVIGYADTEPFRYFIRQLAHASRRVNKDIFKALIQFRSNVEAEDWWLKLQELPYIRKRASEDYISVHDVLRELIYRHVIPARDPDYYERRQINQRLIQCYDKILAEERARLHAVETEFEQEAQHQGGFVKQQQPVDKLTHLFTQRNASESRIWILRAEVLHYLLSTDILSGGQIFIEQFDEATNRHQLTLRQRLTSEIKPLVDKQKLPAGAPEYFEISCRIARQESDDGLIAEALTRVNQLLRLYHEPAQRMQLFELRADCKLGLRHGVVQAIADYQRALKLAQDSRPSEVDCARLEKLIGWSYRQLGNWDRAGFWYERAQKRLSQPQASNTRTLEEVASLYTNEAYVEAFRGNFTKAMDLGQRGLQYRQALGLTRELGMSYSMLGEVCRYHRNFPEALNYYRLAEDIFSELDDRGWLGRLWQEEAICLLQMGGDLIKALEKAKLAIDYCSRYNTLALPSAYNRAARIIAASPEMNPEQRFDQSFFYFRSGIERALEVGDSWFFLSNCVEAMEVVQHEFERTRQPHLFKVIQEIDTRIEAELGKIPARARQSGRGYFPDLLGRRQIILGTLDYLEGFPEDSKKLENALRRYLQGFQLITWAFFGSYGLFRMTEELKLLTDRVINLPRKTALKWRDRFAREWKGRRTHTALKNFADRIDNLLNIQKHSPPGLQQKRVA